MQGLGDFGGVHNKELMCSFSSCVFPADHTVTGAIVETLAQSTIEGIGCSAGQVLGGGCSDVSKLF